MSTPRHILDAVMASVEMALSCTPLQGRAVIVSDRFSGKPGRLSSMLVEREKMSELIEQNCSEAIPADALTQLRNAPTCKVPVIWIVGDHNGAMFYEPTWGVS